MSKNTEMRPEIPPTLLVNGDSISILDGFINSGIKADLIITDPPYKMTSRGNPGGTGGMLKKNIVMSGQVFQHNYLEIDDWIGKLYEVLQESGHCYIMTNDKNLKDYLVSIENAGFNVFKTLIWDKVTPIVNMYYMNVHEYIIFCRKGRAKKINNCGTKSILQIPNNKLKDDEGNNLHDTEKPVGLMRILIENSSRERDLVLDPFMGIGSTGVAAIQTNRRFIGIEQSIDYCFIAKNRMNSPSSLNLFKWR